MHRMDVTNIYKYPQGRGVVVGSGISGWKFVGGLIGDAAVYAIEGLMADRSAAFSICIEPAFSLEGAREMPRIGCLGRWRWQVGYVWRWPGWRAAGRDLEDRWANPCDPSFDRF